MHNKTPVVLGIDPGTSRIGYGAVVIESGKTQCVGYGLIEPNESDPAQRLARIEREIKELVLKFHPKSAAVEKLFFSKNKKTAMAVAQARGAILAALSGCGVPVVELSPADAKAGVTGYGNAQKTEVETMVRRMLGLGDEKIIDDTIDALALAITAAYGEKIRNAGRD